jgi:hypothetical protein
MVVGEEEWIRKINIEWWLNEEDKDNGGWRRRLNKEDKDWMVVGEEDWMKVDEEDWMVVIRY